MPVRYSAESAGPSTRRATPDVQEREDDLDLSVLTKTELQGEAEARGLPTSGNKADLIARLSR